MNPEKSIPAGMSRVFTVLATFFAIAQLVTLHAPALAQHGSVPHQSTRVVSVESWIEEWDPALERWVKVATDDAETRAFDESIPTITTTIVNDQVVSETRAAPDLGQRQAARFALPVTTRQFGDTLAQFGPFIVTSATTAAMVGATDSDTPRQFEAMLREFPQLATLRMIEAPGTSNDLANLEVGRMIRAAGIATHVPKGGSVRSGAVELFLAGVERSLEQGAQFAVHSWLDTFGREATDFAPGHSAHRLYLAYYREMGMSRARARDFYAMTNSVPHSEALWLNADEMRAWLAPEASAPANAAPQIAIDDATAPVLTYGDLSAVSIAWSDVSHLDSQLAFP